MTAVESVTAEAVSFLSRPDAYGVPIAQVSVIETHMSWVFLAGGSAYKLKKSIRQDGLDFSTADLRHHNCLEELRLNQRLAAGVYRAVVALTREPDGRLAIDGSGPPVDWLVHMRRLPASRNLDAILSDGRAMAEEAAIRAAAHHLARFYLTAERQWPADFRTRLADGVRVDRDMLMQPRFGLCRAKVEILSEGQLEVLRRWGAVFDARVNAGRIVEGHGDLRPEHIWLDGAPAIIDCVEFDQALRIVDPADELAFLALECERLGAAAVGGWFLDTYTTVTGDRPPPLLLAFYRVYRAMRRAVIAARHLDDPSVADPARFLARARRFLDMIDPIDAAADWSR